MRFLQNIMFILCLRILSCSGIEIVFDFCKHNFVYTNIETLILNGTTAVQTKVPISCSCTVTQKSQVYQEITVTRHSHSALHVCNTVLELTSTDGSPMETMTCDTTHKIFSYSDLKDGLVFNLRFTPEDRTSISTDTFHVSVKPDSPTLMQVDCKPGIIIEEAPVDMMESATSTSSPTLSSTSSSTVSSTTLRIPASSSSNHTVLIVGVVVGIGLLMLFLISCLLCYIAGRCKIRKDEQQLPSQQPRRPPPRPNFLQRTLTQARDRIIRSRPLPKIPADAEGQTLRTKVIDQDPQSGYYDSIRLDLIDVKDNNNYPSIQECYKNNKIHNDIINQVAPQSSVDSSSSYIHPSGVQVQHDDSDANTLAVSTISDKVEQDNHYIYMRPAKGSNVADNQETDDVYLKSSNTKLIQQGGETLAKNDTPVSIDTDSFYVYSNNFRFPTGEQRIDGSYINTKPSVEKISQGSTLVPEPKHENAEKCENDTSALYLNDMRFSDYENVQCTKHSSNKHEDTDTESPYSNCVNEVNRIIQHSVINSGGNDTQNSDTYIPMNTGQTVVERAEEARSTDSHLNKDAQICDENSIKESACETDSSDYMPMVGCRRNVEKQMLQKQDSTFPNLMSFKVHGASDQHNGGNTIMHPDAHLENVLKPNKIKLKRYVKEKRQS
ncbi:hypothetical protein ACF0H5_008158 [Mactra antiquata]